MEVKGHVDVVLLAQGDGPVDEGKPVLVDLSGEDAGGEPSIGHGDAGEVEAPFGDGLEIAFLDDPVGHGKFVSPAAAGGEEVEEVEAAPLRVVCHLRPSDY